MTMFKAFFKTIYETKTTIIIYFAVFLTFSVIMSKNAEENPIMGDFQDKSFSIVVIDNDHSEASEKLYNFLDETQSIEDIGITNLRKLNDMAKFDMIDYVLIINEGYEDKIKSGNLEGALSYENGESIGAGYALSNICQTWTNNVAIYVSEGESIEDASDAATKIATDVNAADIRIINRKVNDTESDLIGYFFKMGAYALAMTITMSLGMAFARFKEEDVEHRISVSPYSYRKRKTELFLSSLLFCMGVAVAVVIAWILLFGKETSLIKLGLYFINLFVVSAVFLSFALLIETLTHNFSIMNMVGNMLILSQCFLCGMFITRDILSPAVVNFSKCLPFYWYVDSVDIISKYDSLSGHCGEYFLCLGMELLIAMILFAAALLVSRTRERKAI